MPDFLKNFSLKKPSLNKLLVFGFLGLIIFGLLLPINFTQAEVTGLTAVFGGQIKSGAIWIAQAIVGSFLWLIVFLAEGILAIGIALLSGVIGFTLSGTLSFTNPAKNEIIRIGWTLVRDFVNIGFILGLVYIGLATALRITGFELKKVFPWFLIMALLINFTPVICGVVVDAANMVTKFFLGAMANWTLLGEVFKLHMTGLGDLYGGLSWAPVAKFVFLTAFGLAAGFVLLVFAVLLLLRAVIIPLLVIFSPLAFLAYIFPKTKSYFTQWWNQLLQWSFIGAIGGFFLYLSRLALRQQADFSFAIPTEDPALGTFMEQIAPYFMAVAFLMVGLFITLKSSAMGANMVTGFAQKQGMKALKWGGKKLGVGAGAAAVGAARGTVEGKGIKGKIGGALKGALTYGGREKGKEVVERFLEKTHVVRPGFYEEQRRKRWKLDKEVKRLEKLPTERLHAIMKRVGLTPSDIAGKIAAFEVLSKRRALGGDITTPEGKEREGLAKKMIPFAKTYGADLKEMLKARPDWAETPEKIKKQIEGMSPKQVRLSVQPQALQNMEVFMALDLPKVKDIKKQGTSEQKEALNKVVSANFTKLNFEVEKFRRSTDKEQRRYAENLRDKINIIKSPEYRT